MAPNSLFAILLRSPWWISFLVAASIAVLAWVALPAPFRIPVALGGAPFLVIGLIAAWQQLRAPRAAQVAQTLQILSGLSWADFSSALEAAFRREGHTVQRLPGTRADMELVKAGRVSLVSCKRWKAARMGVEPLRELHAAVQSRDAHEGICVVMGEVTDNARQFAAAEGLRLLQGTELAVLLREVRRPDR